MQEQVKIVFRLERDKDGYPPDDWESMWAVSVGGGQYKIDNIPFFVKGIGCDDVVSAEQVDGELRFKALLKPSQNSTVRLIIYDLNEVDAIRKSLVDMGCSVEGSGTPGLISINVPKPKLQDVIAYIRAGFDANRWDYEEAAIRK